MKSNGWLGWQVVIAFFPVAVVVANAATAPPEWSVSSPGGNIMVTVVKEGVGDLFEPNALSYTVKLNGKLVLLKSPLGVAMLDGDFVNGLTFLSQAEKEINETYPMPSGKKSLHINHCNELRLSFRNVQGGPMDVYFRAYDDGMAYRYSFPGKGEKKFITGEASGFAIPRGSKAWLMPWANNYEEFYLQPSSPLSQGMRKPMPEPVGWHSGEVAYAVPALFQLPNNGPWVLLTEAAVYGDYCASRLAGKHRDQGIFQMMLDPDPGTVTSTLPWNTPWRVAIIGETPGPIIESTMVDNLNPPSEIADLSWIQPYRATWTWLWKPVVSSENLSPVFNAFAQEMGWENFRGVGVGPMYSLLSVSDEEIEARIAKGAAAGGRLAMIDFMDSDSQSRMRDYDRLCRITLKYKVMVAFHGATCPRGQRRRWPHIIGYEAVRGEEYYKANREDNGGDWIAPPPTPTHEATLPFIRNVVGPMDYTDGLFSGPGAHPKRTNTNAHELALSVMFENGIKRWGDHPDSYRKIPAAISYLKIVPAGWDDTKFIAGYPGEYCALARRKGKDWFLAMVDGGAPRSVVNGMPVQSTKPDPSTIPYALKFLDPGVEYTLTLHRDGNDWDTIVTETRTVTNQTVLTVPTLPGGGFCGHITPKTK